MRNNDSMDWAISGAPISQVLNDDASSTQHTTEPSATTQYISAAPFSGKLIDLLLDTTRNVTHERRRAVDHLEEPSRVMSENSVITLPQPAQPPAKTARRPRIPPLLQGLHQPPPLPPSGRLFPPITDGVSGFEQEICERIQSGNTIHESRNKKDEDSFIIRTDEPDSPHSTRKKHTERIQDDVPSLKFITNQDDREEVGVLKPSDTPPIIQKQQSRKRKKWSDEETRDLLLGVSRFGIGNWKKILQCSDFKFQGRTAVDLKDRFRVCCPGEGLRPRRLKRKKGDENESATSSREGAHPVESTNITNTGSSPCEAPQGKALFAEGAGDLHRMNYTELVKLGIHTPFAKSTRRPRQNFSAVDDENLLKGFEMHGAAWQTIRDDRDLGFETRHPTDLRDRFRIRYPEAYERAGYKLKAKIKCRPRNADTQAERVEQEPEPKSRQTLLETREIRQPKGDASHPHEAEIEERHVLRTSGIRSLALIHASSPADTGPTLPNFADEDGSMSPIILNRNILQWADANAVSMASASNGVYFGNYMARDTSTNMTIPNDALHINPLATQQLPLLTLSEHTSSTLPPSQQYASNATGPSTSLDPNTLCWSSSSTFPKSSNSASHDIFRTPNLPTIVFPHVPAISARTTVHNLPTPADLLSGLDLDTGEGAAAAAAAEHGTGNESASGFVMGQGGAGGGGWI